MRMFIAIFVLMCGCTLAEVKVEVLSERTALENQVLGTYNSLDNEMLLVASVRGVDSKGHIRKPPKHSQEHKDAITSMQVLAFHADDIQAFKQLRWVGENRQGLLETFSMDKKTDGPDDLKEFARQYKSEEFKAVVSQANQARNVIIRRVIELNENLTEDDLSKVRQIFWKINVENALPGEKIQTQDGAWVLKK